MFKKQQQGKQYHGLREDPKLKEKNKQKEEFRIRQIILKREQQPYKTITLRDIYSFTVADSGKVLECFILVAKFEPRVSPLAQIRSSRVGLPLEPA